MNIISELFLFVGGMLKNIDATVISIAKDVQANTERSMNNKSSISEMSKTDTALRELIKTNTDSITTLDTKIDNVSLNGLPYLDLEEHVTLSQFCTDGYTTNGKTNIVFTIPLPKMAPSNWTKLCIRNFNVVVRQNGYVYGSGWDSSRQKVVNSPLFNMQSFDDVSYTSTSYDTIRCGICNKSGSRVNINGLTLTLSASAYGNTDYSSVVNNEVCSIQLSSIELWFE